MADVKNPNPPVKKNDEPDEEVNEISDEWVGWLPRGNG